jgi:hypothetical protein
MKANSQIFKGIEYVQLNTLPNDQQSKIRETLNRNFLIKILIDGKVIGNCVLYKDYEFWYDSIFNPSSVNIAVAKSTSFDTVTANI